MRFGVMVSPLAPPSDPPADWLASFDGLVKVLLGQLGVSPVIIGLVGLAFSLKSWFDALQDGRAFAGKISGSIGRGIASLGTIPLGIGFMVVLAVSVAQLLVLALAYVFGNFVSIQFQMLAAGDDIGRLDSSAPYYERYRIIEIALQDAGLVGVLSPSIYPALTLDLISFAVVSLGATAILFSYRQAASSGRVESEVGLVAALPVSLYFFLAGFGFLVTLVLGLGGSELNFLLGIVIVSGGYSLTWVVAVKASQLVTNMWQSRRGGVQPGG